MIRDLELCRDALLWIESDQKIPIPDKWSEEQIVYHIALLIEAKLVKGDVSMDPAYGNAIGTATERLTWSGHEYLDAMRDDTIWKNAKKTILDKTTSWTFEPVKHALTKVIAEKVGLQLSP